MYWDEKWEVGLWNKNVLFLNNLRIDTMTIVIVQKVKLNKITNEFDVFEEGREGGATRKLPKMPNEKYQNTNVRQSII